MDQTKNHNLQSLTQYIITSQFLKKITQLLLSLSVFSFFFSYSSWYCCFLRSFKFHFSTFSLQLISHTVDKSYIFLICNGILMFLAKTSSGFIPPALDHLNDQLFKKIQDGDGLQWLLETKDSLLEKEVLVQTTEPLQNVIIVVEEEEEDAMEGESKEDSNLIVEDKEQEEEYGLHATEDEENEKQLGTINGFEIEDDDDDDEEEENGLLSTEELNKKCDDFIRRMKEEIRIGAQQQLVLA